MKFYITILLFLAMLSGLTAQPKLNITKQVELIEKQYEGMLKACKDTSLFPQSLLPDGTVKQMKSAWWCSGFFSGNLWYIYELTHQRKWKEAAEKWTLPLQKEQYNTSTHDLGFMLYCSFGNGYRLTKNEMYKPILITGARSLSTRFHPKTGLIKSWDGFKRYKYPVIIDNMMNLEYLFWAAKATGESSFYHICVSHADQTIKNHFREDNSSYHVICYDSLGNVLAKKTAQGYADQSAWARGQAWGLYGFTVMYRETKDPKYLDQAIHIADFYINHPHLPKDKIPYWDFNAPDIPDAPRDASAAAVAASGLLELSRYVTSGKKEAYFSFAAEVLQSLSGPGYFISDPSKCFLLLHSTGNKPANSEVDVPIIYADYYYLEALLRYSNIIHHRKVIPADN